MISKESLKLSEILSRKAYILKNCGVKMNRTDINKICENFKFIGEIVSIDECKTGHINSTFIISTDSKNKYTLQKINNSVFKNPEDVMSNIVKVTEHIRQKLIEKGIDEKRGTLNVIFTHNGKFSFTDSEGNYWRAYDYIENVSTYQKCDSIEMFAKVGRAFGNFQSQLADFDASLLFDSIPNFHNTQKRYENFMKALNADIYKRASGVQDEIKFVTDRQDKCNYIICRLENGTLPLRVTHNDTKLNNILIDDITKEGICIIDLDTVMLGSVLYDFGDAIRSGASSATEDETDLSKVSMRLDMFEAFTKGFVEGLNNSLTKEEILAMPMGAIIITFETGMRFLTDYLSGDTYFRISYPQHNLDRARNQFKLVLDMETKLDEMNKIIEKYL